MKLAIMQPYFMPYIGYFQLIKAAETFVVYDDVNYIKGGWINRNNILIDHKKKLFTIHLKNASPNLFINDIEIIDDFRKFTKTIQLNYKKAPHFQEVYLLLENIISYKNRNLSEFIINSLNVILNYLKIETKLLISSQLNKNTLLKGKDKVIEICKLLDARTYINPIGGQKLYSKDEFSSHGINLMFLESQSVTYKQLNNIFIPTLSIIDVLMFNSVCETNELLTKFKLI